MEKSVKSIRIKEVVQKVPIGRSTVYLWIQLGKFPKGSKPSAGVRMWNEKEIDDFIEGKWNV